ncbi:nucleoside phosphorylase domain-containing protein [Aspergillus insuetus]
MRTHSDYRIGWICALPIELAAAEAMLDQVHDSLPNRLEDENTYILGSIAKHSIVVACLPAGVYGTTSATSVATHMKISFPALRFCLLVGIAGGAPGPQADIRLGDIVVSKPTAGYGGVIQYDYGKALAGEFRPTGFLNKPPAVLLTAVARLQARHHLHGTNIHRVTTRIFKTHDRLSGTFSSPAQDKDLLFLSSYEHVGNEEDCLACDKSKVQPRPTRRSIEPQVFYGLVASANQVLRDAARRTTLSRQHGILCFEMEAAGIMDVLPCLVIRGVCDYCDSHKNKRWQAYAATTAAAYTKELLSVIPFQAVTRTPVVNLSASYMQSLDHVDHSDQRQPSPVPSVRDSPAGSSAQSQWAQSLESSPSPSPITELPTSPGSKPNDQPLESIGASQTDCVVDFTTQPSEAASPQPAVSIKSEPDKIIVAMDIGSRYTRVAYATAQDTRLGKTTPITRWPNHDDPVDKVPTLVSYQNWLYSWGYDIPETDIPFPWLWAVLLSDTDFSEYAVLNTDRIPVINRARGPLPSVHDLPAGHAISHYLRALWMHTVQTMRGNLGPDTVDRTRFHIVLTLPTVWDRGGQRALRKAAKIAGLLQRRQAGATKLNIVRKSTAAAQAAMYESIRDARLGDSYVICYAGGRSMDVGTYRVSTLLDMSRSVGRKCRVQSFG